MTLTKKIQEKSIKIMYKIKKPLFLAVFCMVYVKRSRDNLRSFCLIPSRLIQERLYPKNGV